MCFFNRFRFQCGHQQYAIFHLCAAARDPRSRAAYPACRPSKRNHPNFRKWDMLGPCESCLRRQYAHHRTGLWNAGIGVPGDSRACRPHNPHYTHPDVYPPYYQYRNDNHSYRYPHQQPSWGRDQSHYPEYNCYPEYHGYNGYDGCYECYDDEDDNDSYYYNSPRDTCYRRADAPVPSINPDECDEPECMTISTPKTASRRLYDSGYGRPHRGSGGSREGAVYMYADGSKQPHLSCWDASADEGVDTGGLRMIEGPGRYDDAENVYLRRGGVRMEPEVEFVD
ncbi:hypothetical protein DRE_06081 [Drechslerella stenobrocha 248]|uniref:Uncharacterized protein n=1 Tax=Drechslerella stenobrocha 248 TaxID=1043628 RepID=W7HZ21_9PEZI|nr:hypothetical protein DRE_06081 [Drechslerella stenobrocha 248]